MILALASLFYVTKAIKYIHMVFDATVRNLNDFLWGLEFMLPPMGSLLIMVGPKTHMVDLDSGEMFYNF